MERRAERKTGYSAQSDLSGGVALAGELQALHGVVTGSRCMERVQTFGHTAEEPKAMPDADSMVEVPVLVARCSPVEVHISSQPCHQPFEQLSVQMPLTAED